MKEMFVPLRKYATFKGRASRKECWLFLLFVAGSLALIRAFLHVVSAQYVYASNVEQATDYVSMLPIGYLLLIALPTIAVTVRRLHDIDKPGWMIGVVNFPIVGAIWLLLLLLEAGTDGANKFGPDPRNPEPEWNREVLDYQETHY